MLDKNKDPEIHLYPNPASDVLKVWCNSGTGSFQLRILDMQGRLVMQEEIILGKEVKELYLPKMSSGLYSVYVRSQEGSLEHSSIIEVMQ